jgi:hypothetical protein
VSRRVTLVALWAVFAVASVSVGFAALGLVSDPFTDVGTTADASSLAGPAEAAVTESDTAPGDQATGTASPSTPSSTSTPPPTPDATPTKTHGGSGATRTAGPTKSSSPASSGPSLVKGGVPTEGGYVSGTCKGALVSVGAAPAVYWQMDSITPGWAHTARVRLEPAKDAHGERVVVTATCQGGDPVFHVDFNSGDGGGGDGGGDGGGGDGGSGGSGSDGSDHGGGGGSSDSGGG